MNKIKLENISKKYQIGKNNYFYAIKNISLLFPDTGIVSISGKSGSGKSTIINMIAGLDKPTEGKVLINDTDITKLNNKKLNKYFKGRVGILFQNYNLLEDETVLFNVSISLLINGEQSAKAKNKAKEMLNQVGLEEELYAKKASLLSGGEKQRVAIARALINEPEIILCDEPTGALDSKNSVHIMNILKQYSKNHLVILVSHNPQLVNKYSDRIIYIRDGKIYKDKNNVKNNVAIEIKNKRTKKSSSWIDTLSMSNFKRRFKRNLFSIFSLSISLISTFLTVGFINGKDSSINESSVKQLDFGSGTICEEEVMSEGGLLSLTRTIRPTINKLNNNKFLQQNFNIVPNFDAILPINPTIKYDGEIIEEIYYYPIYSFADDSYDKSLLVKGKFPSFDSLNEVVINNKCYEYLKAKYNKEILNEHLDINNFFEYPYIDFDETVIVDNFNYENRVKITGVVKELDYLQNPKIYYSYLALESYLQDYLLTNLSTYFNQNISWFDRILNAENFDQISSYSYRVFLKNYKYREALYDDIDLGNKLSYSSPSILVRSSLFGFLQVAEYGLLIFLIITIAGSVLIIGIMSFTSYSEDHKTSAILTCLGADESEICSIYLNESLFNGFVSLVLSFLISMLLEKGINLLITKFIDLNNLIAIPITSFIGIKYFFPLISLLACLLICVLSTSIPIIFSKKVSLKEELQSI